MNIKFIPPQNLIPPKQISGYAPDLSLEPNIFSIFGRNCVRNEKRWRPSATL